MKTKTLNSRLEKRYTGSKSAKAYQIVKDLIDGTGKSYMVVGNIIRPCHTSGSGRFTTNLDYTNDTAAILRLIGVKFESGNDSPRGGKTGNYIKILTKIEK